MQGNAELLSISSNDSIWNSDDEIDPGKYCISLMNIIYKIRKIFIISYNLFIFLEEYEVHKKNFQSSYRNGMDINGKGKYFDKQVEDDEEEDLNVVDDSEEYSNQSSSGTIVRDVHDAREKYKKSILHRYLADSVDAANTLQDHKENPSKSSETKDSVKEQSSDENSEQRVQSKDLISPKLLKRKISDSSDDKEEKIPKTQNRGRNNITSSRSLDSVANYPHSNSSSNTSSLRRKNTQPVKSSTTINQSR